MKHQARSILGFLSMALASSALPVPAQNTAFNYLGALTDAGGPAQGQYDLQFRLYDADQAGNQIGPALARAPVEVVDGSFSVELDFGAGAFDGSLRWLELAVRSNGVAQAHAVMAPRQRILPLPYAIHAATAGSVAGDGVTAAAIQNATITADKLAGNQVVKSLNSLRDDVELRAGANLTIVTNDHALVLSAFDDGSADDDWHLSGNLGTTAGLNFLGTIDDAPLEVKVNSLRGLRLQPDAPSYVCDVVSGTIAVGKSPSLIGGYFGNWITEGVAGSVIAGGGAFDLPCLGGNLPNLITADMANINGGLGNEVRGSISTVGGGYFNRIEHSANYCVIAGGGGNLISSAGVVASAADGSTISGGSWNEIRDDANASTIGGGGHNLIEANINFATIGGGEQNDLAAHYATAGGGSHNRIELDSDYAVIAGGAANRVGTNAQHSVVGGGNQNSVSAGAYESAIGGGALNAVGPQSSLSTIGGGARNLIYNDADHAVIAGGWDNAVLGSSASGTVSGGYHNAVGPNSPWSTVGGGRENGVTNAPDATIGGGNANRIDPGSAAATVAGGQQNVASAMAATVPGGYQAHARLFAQQAYAGGRFGQNGDAQTSTFVVRGITSDATPRELFLDQAAKRITMPKGGAWTFDIQVVARDSSGASAGYKLCGVIENDTGAGTCALVGLPEVAFEREQRPAWNVMVEADDANDALVIRVFGESGRSIRWVATVRTSEVIY